MIKYTKKQNQIIVLEKEIQELKQVQTVKKEQSLPQPPAQPLSQPTTNITLPDPASLNIRLAEPKAKWIGNNLDVQFNIQYIKEDGGNQQGKILILARGPEILLAYPSGALNVKELKSFLNPDKGEFFSVSRFRIGNTKFGLVLQKEYISEVQILIFNKDNELLLVEAIIPEKMSKKTTNKQATPIPTSSPQ
ncbi:MAG: hypothetical protein HY072_00715 [Deltaproteobacteria bacterium]|nr:hypothetical protein [Deltaproteobacteria bacterium]